MINRTLISVARRIYKAIPAQPLRQLAYSTFAHLVRNRHSLTTIDGVTFELDLGEVIDLSLYLQQYEPDVTAAIVRYTKPGMTIVDIGANIGAHTTRFAMLTGPGGRVIAFEPTDYAFAKLQRNLSLNDMPQVQAVKVALSDADAPAREVNFRASWRSDGSRRDGVSRVAFERFDAWSERHQIDRVDLVKIDVDGNEFPVITGARQMIERSSPIMLMEAAALHFNSDETNPFLLLERIGYSFALLSDGTPLTAGDIRNRLPQHDPEMTTSINVMAQRKVG